MDLDGRHQVTPAGPLYDGFPALWSPDERSLAMNGRDLADETAPRAFLDPDGVAPARPFALEGDPYLVDWQRLAP
jgi:hypothetical protein